MKGILQSRLASVLLVLKVSRLFRVAYRGFQFFQEEVVEEQLRAISVSQGIDTIEEKTWKQLAYMYGIMDEMLLTTIADHVRASHRVLFSEGYVTGALPVGFRAVPVPGAPRTKLGRERRIAEIDPEAAKLILRHFKWHLDGMSIAEGWRRWVEGNGPYDPRSKDGRMSATAYRRMLSNPRLTGVWVFGRTRSVWSNKRDYARKVQQPETEILTRYCEDLCIVPQELFLKLQAKFAKYRLGPTGPRKRIDPQLWDMVTDCFHCESCNVRFYSGGARADGMRCKLGKLCPTLTVINRKKAISNVCQALAKLVEQGKSLVDAVAASAARMTANGDETVREELAAVESSIVNRKNKIDDLTDVAGQGSVEDRSQHKAKIRKTQHELVELRAREA